MYSHASGADDIVIQLCCEHQTITIKRLPYIFHANRGYVEPTIDPAALPEEGYIDDEEF